MVTKQNPKKETAMRNTLTKLIRPSVMVMALMLPIIITNSYASTTSLLDRLTNHSNEKVLNIEEWKTRNGAQVLYVHLKELPIVDINITFNAGSARDGKLYGLASFTSAMIGEGTKSLNADQIAEKFDTTGAQFGTDSSRDAATISLRSLSDSKQLDPSLDTFVEVINDVTFPKDSFERIQKQTLQSLKLQQQNPSTVASIAFYKALYGDYPYGHNPMGDADSVTKITIDDVKSFYENYYVANNATIAIVGDIDRGEAEKIAMELVYKLPAGNTAPPLPPVASSKNNIVHVEFPATQTSIRIGQLGIKRDDPDYFPLYVGNYILGGGVLVSRLFTEVREKNGLTYNVSSGFIPMKNTGPFIIGLQTRNQVKTQAIDLTNSILSDFIEKGPSGSELTAAKNNLIGGFPLRIDSNSSIASNLILIGFYNLPLDYLDTYRDNINKVSASDIEKSFKKHIDPKQLITVTVGPADESKS
jgi:zinc protease